MSAAYARPVADISGTGVTHPGFTIGMILAIFDLQVTLMLPTKFGVN